MGDLDLKAQWALGMGSTDWMVNTMEIIVAAFATVIAIDVDQVDPSTQQQKLTAVFLWKYFVMY